MIVNQGIYGEKARKKLSQCIFTEAAQRSRWITRKKEIAVAQRKQPSEKSPRFLEEEMKRLMNVPVEEI